MQSTRVAAAETGRRIHEIVRAAVGGNVDPVGNRDDPIHVDAQLGADRPHHAAQHFGIEQVGIGLLDRDITNNARLVGKHKDIRPAVVLTARWTLYVDELLRTYVGVDR